MPHFVIGNKPDSGRSPWASPYFYIVALILSATLALYLIGAFTIQHSRITLLVVPKGEASSFQAGPIIDNLVTLSRKLSFYDRILFDDPGISDSYAGLSKDERKEKWNRQFEISRNGNGTMLDITIYHSQHKEAERLARQFAASLTATAGQFYDLEESLAIKVVEGPITAPVIRFPYRVAILSLAGGVLAAFAFFYLGQLIASVPARPKKQIFRWPDLSETKRGEALDGKILPHFPYVPEELSYEPRFRRSAAPPNLPVEEEIPAVEEMAVPEDLPIFDESGPVESEGTLPPTEEAPLAQGEPTEEEYRQRLNKLLRGEM